MLNLRASDCYAIWSVCGKIVGSEVVLSGEVMEGILYISSLCKVLDKVRMEKGFAHGYGFYV